VIVDDLMKLVEANTQSLDLIEELKAIKNSHRSSSHKIPCCPERETLAVIVLGPAAVQPRPSVIVSDFARSCRTFRGSSCVDAPNGRSPRGQRRDCTWRKRPPAAGECRWRTFLRPSSPSEKHSPCVGATSIGNVPSSGLSRGWSGRATGSSSKRRHKAMLDAARSRCRRSLDVQPIRRRPAGRRRGVRVSLRSDGFAWYAAGSGARDQTVTSEQAQDKNRRRTR
jgi:hypothetical protein